MKRNPGTPKDPQKTFREPEKFENRPLGPTILEVKAAYLAAFFFGVDFAAFALAARALARARRVFARRAALHFGRGRFFGANSAAAAGEWTPGTATGDAVADLDGG